MARFTLVVRPDGKAILTCLEALSQSHVEELRAAFAAWREGEFSTLIVAETDVVQVIDVELDLATGLMVRAD